MHKRLGGREERTSHRSVRINRRVGAVVHWWLTFGSFSPGGIALVGLNETTGSLSDEALAACAGRFPFCWADASRPASPFRNLADNWSDDPRYEGQNALEASYLYHHPASGDHFLFVNYYWCCRGLQSTYEIRVGRASRPTGPYRDKSGKSMTAGGGTLLLRNVTAAGGHAFVGPGHAGILRDPTDGRYAFTFDYMAIDQEDHVFKTQARELVWDALGWPVVSTTNFEPKRGEAVELAHSTEFE